MLVSIIMPTYNCGKYIADSVKSVLAQTVSDWELLIVDDCSTDNTKTVLNPYLEKYPNIRYYCLDHNSGPAGARNKALRCATGKYIAFLDSDDLWSPDKLERQIAFMEKHNCPFTATAYAQMDENGADIGMVCFPPKKVNYQTCIRLSNPIGNLTVMYDREQLGDFQVPNIKKRNDFALWLQLLKATPYCCGMDEVLARYRVRKSGSVSSNKLDQAKYHWQLYHEIEGHRLLRSTYEMGCWAFVKGTGIGLRRKRSK